ncbi:hypothetical protein JTB14_027404 [Gonioctena quinquepunctata]|nr:hypothetical protein JTB14_027404 [Gonioctena quinquepunctata]
MACQTEEAQIGKKDRATQSLAVEIFSNHKPLSTPNTQNVISEIKSRMLIVAGSNGKELANVLLGVSKCSTKANGKVRRTSNNKAQCPDDELIKTAVYYSTSFTKNDIVLI